MQNGTQTPDARLQTGFAIQPPAGVMGWLPPQYWTTIKEFYGYGCTFLPIAAGGTETRTISVQADADFIILFATMVATSSDNLTPLAFAPALVQLRDNSDGGTLLQVPTHVESVFGDAQRPGIFSIPYYLRANSSLAVELQNLDPVNARNYRFTFYGFRNKPNSDYRTGRLR